MFRSWILIVLVITFMLLMVLPSSAVEKKENPKVVIATSMGEIELELYPDKAPISVENFLSYVREGFYNPTIIHRVVPGFVIQGGGYDTTGKRKQTKPPIKNEADNGLKNYRGTICYARTTIVNSATSQFFINLVDNPSLDHRNKTQAGYGYAVFGKVTKGMKVVDAIGKVKTKSEQPIKPVVILSIKEIKEIKEEK